MTLRTVYINRFSGIPLITLIFFLFLPSFALAHTNGLPLTTINNTPTLANQAYAGYSDQKMIIPQDLSPKKYSPNTPLTFELLEKNLSIPQETINKIKFRWHWDTQGSEYSTGTKASHTYTEIGSHIVAMQALIPGNPDFVDLNTIQIDIVPSQNYKLPEAIITSENQIKPGTTVQFTNKVTLDPSSTVTSYLWKLDALTYSQEKTPTHLYSGNDTFEYIYLQVRDSKGFIHTTNTTLYTKKSTGIPTPSPKQPSSNNMWWILGIAVTVIALLAHINKKWQRS